MDKIIKTSKTIRAILKVLFWVVAVVSVVILAAILVVLFMKGFVKGGTALDDGFFITLGNYSLLLNQEYSSQQLTPLYFMTSANVALFGTLSCYIIRVLLNVFEPMSQGKPFSTTISVALKKLAYAILIMGIISFVLQIATNLIFYNVFDIPSLFNADRVESCSISIVSDGSFIIWFFILRLVGHIFKYGETLQQLSDETL